ncbi:class I SAM-dependent methyltransferase [Siminovitchia acidinfaciens]|uniref:Class I SAM-dependent methyltransferase n=1 Tax=Siminovitchia acidinfaciens TaxID=2321395 RepID=A0A429Y4N4_9BACI|nr:class I SAM-dependent methyltransferase [Siminovitchia acidinfaciens]RST76392.1 class I SAM-dependent methyltransferase [Siminovitchia acidinfaciens]
MKKLPIEKLFSLFDDTTEILQEELQTTYLESLAETGENIFQQKIMQSEVSEITKKRLEKKYSEIQLPAYSSEDVRRAFQFAILKGMKENVQANHQMTPDTIGYFINYLIGKFMADQSEISILDPAVGTGNLLMSILNRKGQETRMKAYGVDVDDLLLKLAYTGANLQMQGVELFNQDALQPLFIDPVDAVVCDLPVGYYPDDANAASYSLKKEEGHSYAHHLFIEQSINHTKPGGYLFFLIPNNLFETEEAPKLHEYLKETVYIQAVLQLPPSMFANSQAAKSILVLQKKKPGVKAPKEVLLAAIPKLSNKEAMDRILMKMEKWFKDNKKQTL